MEKEQPAQALLAGGAWGDGAACGSRARNGNNARSNVNANNGGRRSIREIRRLDSEAARDALTLGWGCFFGESQNTRRRAGHSSSGSEKLSRRFFGEGGMKRAGNLWEKFVSEENFALAYRRAIKGKSRQRQVREFMKDEAGNLERVRQLVVSGKFRTSKYRERKIYEPKERIIYKLPFCPDRIVHHAVMNVLRPIFTGKFIHGTYACIEGRGQHRASVKCSEYVRKNRYCLKCDVRKFYPSIDQRTLSAMLSRIIKDGRFLAFVDEIIFSFPGGKNCPIGNYCSQWFGNFYLSALDNFVKHVLKCRCYERFCDDFLLFSDDKKYLGECRERIRAFLRDSLSLKYSKAEVFDVRQGVDFCGYRHFGKYVLARKSTAKRMKRRVAGFRKHPGRHSEEHVAGSVASMKGWLKWCCSHNLKRSMGIG